MARRPPASPDRILLAATTMDEFILAAVQVYGSIRAAAEGIKVPYSTLRAWFQRIDGEADSTALYQRIKEMRVELDAAMAQLEALRGMLDDLAYATGDHESSSR